MTVDRLRVTTLSVLSTSQYDAVPIQSSVVLCSCSSPSMVRNQVDSSLQPVAAACGSRQELNMESTLQQPPQPRKKRPEDFKFGKILGEGSFSTVSICGSCLSVLRQRAGSGVLLLLSLLFSWPLHLVTSLLRSLSA